MTSRSRLADLLSPVSLTEFFASNWPHAPAHIDGRGRDLADLLGIKNLGEFHALLDAWTKPALVLPAKGGDEALAHSADALGARSAYAAGRPIFFDRPETHYSELAEWIAALRTELGIPAQARFVSAIHASPGGTDTTLHFDHSASFILQIRGSRLWTLWPSTEHPNPTNRHSIAMDRLNDDLADYGPKDPLPPTRDGKEVLLRQGDVLYVPNGWWHSVVSKYESLALMFIAINYTWADVVSTALRTKLVSLPEWREMAIGARQDAVEHRRAAEVHGARLLQNLPAIVSSITTKDLLLPRYSRAADAHGHIDAKGQLQLETQRASATVNITTTQATAFGWIGRRSGSFTEGDVEVEIGRRAELIELLRLLTSVGYLNWK